MKNKKILNVLILLFMTIALFSCKGLIAELPETDPVDLNPMVHVTLTSSEESGARTILPTTENISEYELWGSSNEEEQALLGSFSTTNEADFTLAAGTWSFTLKAKNEAGDTFLTGTLADIELAADPVTLSFVLEPESAGTGTMDITVNWPDTVGGSLVYYMLMNLSDEEELAEEEKEVTVNTFNYTYGEAEIEAGEYLYIFAICNDDGDPICIVNEVVVIKPGMVSSKTIDLVESDFNSAPAAPSNFTASIVPVSENSDDNIKVKFTWDDNSNNESKFVYYIGDSTSWNYKFNPGMTSGEIEGTQGLEQTYTLLAENRFGESEITDAVTLNIPYLVHFDSRDGSEVPNQQVLSGEALALPEAPIKEGWIFGGWFTGTNGGGTEYTDGAEIASSITLYAYWGYQVVYHSNGSIEGTLPVDATLYEEDDEPTVLGKGTMVNNSLQDGISVSFDGWNTAADGSGTPYIAEATLPYLTGSVNLYAQWTVIGGIGPAGGTVFYDDEADGTDDIPDVRYLETAPAALSESYAWEDVGELWYQSDSYTETGVTDTAIGKGHSNSLKIAAFLENNTAADYCLAHSVENNGKTYDDWYLPSWDELFLIYNTVPVLGNTDIYWSSSERTNTHAAFLYTNNGTMGTNQMKYKEYSLMPIRGFNSAEPQYEIFFSELGQVSCTPKGEAYTFTTGSCDDGAAIFIAEGEPEWKTSTGETYSAGQTITPSSDMEILVNGNIYGPGWEGPAGGVICYDDEADGVDDIPGIRFLEVAAYDASFQNKGWSNVDDASVSDLSGDMGAGLANSFKIINQTGHTESAAQICLNYSIENNGITYDDWYLPSTDEVTEAYDYYDNNDAGGIHAWISQDDSYTDGLVYNGSVNTWSKATLTQTYHYAWPIRGFNGTEVHHFVSYDNNGGTGTAVDGAFYTDGDTAELNDGATISNLYGTFHGWNTQADGNGTSYSAGEEIDITDSDITLYAEWTEYVVGDTGPAGGIIFYDNVTVHEDGWRYMEAGSTDTTEYIWGTRNLDLSGSDATAIGTGKTNTASIIAQDTASTNNAAHACADYGDGTGYDDWFLPSNKELEAVYNNLYKNGIGGYVANTMYWTSSEWTKYNALYGEFGSTYGESNQSKSIDFCIIPVRSF